MRSTFLALSLLLAACSSTPIGPAPDHVDAGPTPPPPPGLGCPDGSAWLSPPVSEMALPIDITSTTATGQSGDATAADVAAALANGLANFCTAPGCCLAPGEWLLPREHVVVHVIDAPTSAGGDGINRWIFVWQAVRVGYNTQTAGTWQTKPVAVNLDGYANWTAFCAAWLGWSLYPDGASYEPTAGADGGFLPPSPWRQSAFFANAAQGHDFGVFTFAAGR